MARKPAHLQENTHAILRAHAFDLFGRYGYEGVSIGDIADRAKLSKGALYWHFPGKEALYLDCLKRLHGIFTEDIFDPVRNSENGLVGIARMFQGLRRMFTDPRLAGGIAGFWLIPSTPATAAIIATQKAYDSECVGVIADCLRRGVAQGSLDLGNDLEPMARAVISLIEACLLPMRNLEPEEIEAQLGVLERTLLRAYQPAPKAR